MDRIATGTTNSHVRARPEAILDWAYEVPSLTAQRKIAATLDELDRQIETLKAQVNKLERLSGSYVAALISAENGKRVFVPEFQSEFPVNYQLTTVAAVCEQVTVGIVIEPSKLYHPEGTRPLVRSFNIKPFDITRLDLMYMRDVDSFKVRKSEIRGSNDVLVVRTGTPGTAAVAPEWLYGGNCVDLLLARVNPRAILSGYLAIWINSQFGKDHVLKKQGGLAQQHFNTGELQKMPLMVPSVERQMHIVEGHRSLLNEIANTEKQIAKLSSIKEGLVSWLIGGSDVRS